MTKSRFLGLLALFFLMGLRAAPARAADEQRTTPHIIIVGIDKYADDKILPRQHAEADARALYDLFLNKDYLGVDAKNVRLLLGVEDAKRNSKPATRANILEAFQWAAQNAGRDDPVIVALLTQGAALPDPTGVGARACYFASDSTFENRAKDAVASGDIENALDKLKSRRFAAFLDVNFMGVKLPKDKAPDPDLTKLYKEFQGKDDDKAPVGRVIFLANSGLKPTLELQDHGVFTKVLIDGLKGAADREGYEPDGVVTVNELATYLRKQLPALARKHGQTDEQKAQFPLVLEGQGSDFVLDLNPAVTASVTRRVAAFDKLAAADKLAKDLVEEGHNLLTRMPKLEAQQNLRKAYQKLADGKLALADFSKQRTDILARRKDNKSVRKQ